MSSAALAHELILGRYRPLRPLGSGGMGQVWLARDERSGLDVALKIVPREGKAAARAEREAKAAAALRHPRCQRVYALARDNGHVYIAYEYVPGPHAARGAELRRARRSRGDEVAAQLLDALAHAHRRGIVHRDVKPSNVLLAEADGIDVRLLDFGLAQMAEFDTLTALGDVPGTLAYVSPERLHGQEATEAADVWAVGVMLWEALARAHPFRAATMSETSACIAAGARAARDAAARPAAALLQRAVAAALALNPRAPAVGRRPGPSCSRTGGAKKRRGRGDGPTTRARPPESWQRSRCASVRSRQRSPRSPPAGSPRRCPFYPAGWPLGLAAGARRSRRSLLVRGLAFALATAVLPLGNLSLALALLFAAVAGGWLALTWDDPRNGLLFVGGPLLAPFGALGLMPLVAQLARGPVPARRARRGGRARRGARRGTARR